MSEYEFTEYDGNMNPLVYRVDYKPEPNVTIRKDLWAGVEKVYGKEYSHTDWFSVYHGLAPYAIGDPNLVNVEDHDAFATPDPLQVVSWDGLAGRIGGNSNCWHPSNLVQLAP